MAQRRSVRRAAAQLRVRRAGLPIRAQELTRLRHQTRAAAAELAAPVVPSALAKPRAPSADLTPSPDAPPARAPGAGGAAAAPGRAPAADDDPASLVGRRLRVWWPEERAFFEGTVVSYDAAAGTHGVSYDDGDDESVRLADERVEWLPDAPKRCDTHRHAARGAAHGA